jgi:putative ATP-binding cassette transporter
MTQTAGAFGRVEGALNFFVARYQSLASYKAVVEHLATFRSAIDEARRLGMRPPRIERTERSGRDLVLRDLVLYLPDGREIVYVNRATIEAGVTTLVAGPSGSGKSRLFLPCRGSGRTDEARSSAPCWCYDHAVAAASVCPVGHVKDRGRLSLRRRRLW